MNEQDSKPSHNATKDMRARAAAAPPHDLADAPEHPVDKEWRQRAVELHTKFVEDLIEAQDFCPWAKSARFANRTRVVALWTNELETFISQVVVGSEADAVEVWQLVVLDGTERAMRWRGDVADLEQHLRRRGVDLPWALAAFHPQHPGRPESIGGVIGMLRRSPLPAIQLVRLDVLDRVRERAKERVDGLAEENRQKMQHWVKQEDLVQKHERLLRQGIDLMRDIADSGTEDTP